MRKGFLFTLLTLVIIVFMLMELNIYFRTFELRQEGEPNRIRSQVVSNVASQFSSWAMAKTVKVPLTAALQSMVNDSTRPPSSANLANVTWGLAWNGTRTDFAEPPVLPENSTLYYWDSKMKQTVSAMNLELSTSYYNFNISQSDAWTVQCNFSIAFNLTDPVSKVKINAVNPVSVNISIIGFEDPLLSRNLQNPVLKRSIERISPSPQAQRISSGEKGRGWFYGQPVRVRGADEVTYDTSNKGRIMITDRRDIAESYGNIYGAVIITNFQNIQSPLALPGLNVPFFVNESIDIDDTARIPNTPLLIVSDRDDRPTGIGSGEYHYIYTLGTVNNMTQCGLYTERPNRGYSFLARLTNNLIADPFGIETTLAGSWVASPDRSAVDYDYLALRAGSKVMGLPGCHDIVSCNMSGAALKPMRMTAASAANYGLSDLICSPSRCG